MNEVKNYRSCPSHCCKNHGCKYGYDDCPITTGEIVQETLCEQCTFSLDDTYPHVSYVKGRASLSVAVGYEHMSGSLNDLPSEEEVIKLIGETLVGRRLLNGWVITTVN